VAVGFDVLGYSASFTGDRVRAARTSARGVRIAGITGVVVDLPLAVEKNTAGMAVAAMAEALDLDFGFELTIEKGIPLGSGLGGSAASAVAAVVAANALLDRPLDNLRLLKFAMQGELVASGTAHIDNIAPSLYGGLVLCVGIDDPHIKQIPVPSTVRSVLVRPHRILETRGARAMLGRTVTLSDVVWQQANLAGVVAGCFTADLPLIAASLEDVLIEPQRKGLIRDFRRSRRRDVARRARLFDLGRGTNDVRVGGGEGGRGTRRHGGRVSRGGHHERRVDHADRAGRCEDSRRAMRLERASQIDARERSERATRVP
jgi:homoserine kinase